MASYIRQDELAIWQDELAFGRWLAAFDKMSWPFGKMSWPFDKMSWPFGKMSWPFGKMSWPFGKMSWPLISGRRPSPNLRHSLPQRGKIHIARGNAPGSDRAPVQPCKGGIQKSQIGFRLVKVMPPFQGSLDVRLYFPRALPWAVWIAPRWGWCCLMRFDAVCLVPTRRRGNRR
uniref:Uncharacterized protein n=1 Tax=Candidatus Kentrum sp. DK TaxID=2126562 RepID=A0A450S9M3_9GAMM|nr:MAG: hypothetical protein BECKDK2373C_GA0170839_102245 [Candidatus Kentron sp. DK]